MSATLKVPAWERAAIYAALIVTCPLWIPLLGIASVIGLFVNFEDREP